MDPAGKEITIGIPVAIPTIFFKAVKCDTLLTRQKLEIRISEKAWNIYVLCLYHLLIKLFLKLLLLFPEYKSNFPESRARGGNKISP